MRYFLLLFLLFKSSSFLFSQSYETYFRGNPNDAVLEPEGGLCLMGGASENDEAMRWFLRRVKGGDVLVLRTSGSDGYNDYLYEELGININSVETIVFNEASASQEAYIHKKIQEAEGIWLAGGDQWEYISYWRNSPVAELLNEAIHERKAVIGGTSAGMAVQGGFYFSAEKGTIRSEAALSNPYDEKVRVDSISFLQNPYLENVITDTHYDNPDRKGRHLSFLARILVDYKQEAHGIACDEYTAVCIDQEGMARVFGGYPEHEDNAYFIQPNCALSGSLPEDCRPGTPLHWNLEAQALQVYSVKGTASGNNRFDLKDWKSTQGAGQWEYWYIDQGEFKESPGLGYTCEILTNIEGSNSAQVIVFPNPTQDELFIKASQAILSIGCFNEQGQAMEVYSDIGKAVFAINTKAWKAGIYLIQIQTLAGKQEVRILKP